MQSDVKHRRDFTFRMLKEACSYKNKVNQFYALYLTRQNIGIPEENWQLLEVFHDAALFFS